MYNHFFGFKERPFKLSPDPVYLFFSKSHEEAMANLVYAVSQGDGFVKIVGEAGTGKTTICRSFIEKIKDETEVAYIFNPKMDSLQLLKAINDEFEIDSDADNLKDLIDTLNAFLLQVKAQKKLAILLIDEAHNLSAEILEQLRLLSNLETTTDKLLQIILVGQPELDDILDAPNLRQLTQRITLNCYLRPLSRQETRAYIEHRIHIASRKPVVKFSRAAIGSIYRYTKGIPRLINIASDRALLVAFCLNKQSIDEKISRTAIRELALRGYGKSLDSPFGSRPVLLFCLLMATLFIFILYHLGLLNFHGSSTAALSEKPQPAAHSPVTLNGTSTGMNPGTVRPGIKTHKIIKPDSVPKPAESRQKNFLQYPAVHLSKQEAVIVALKLWGIEAVVPIADEETDRNFFSRAAEQNGFSYLPVPRAMEMVKKLNLPVIVPCDLTANERPAYIVVSALNNSTATLRGWDKHDLIEIQTDELKAYWSGAGHIFWKNFRGLTDSVPFRLTRGSIFILKAMLQEIGFVDIRFSPFYDIETNEAIEQIQKKHGLEADGIVGPHTMIALYNEIKQYKIPHLTQQHAERIFEE